MFKKTMTFDDLDGNEVEQTFYFNYNLQEIAELLEFGRVMRFEPTPGVTYLPLEEMYEKLSTPREKSGLSNQENNEQAYRIFQNLLLDAYGVKGDDNVSFNKTPELRHYWSTHVAFPELVFEFLGNEALGAEFLEKCLPPKKVASVKKDLREKHSIPEGSLKDMMAEAERRQADPATRIEPGPEAARAALGESPQVEALAQSVADGGVPAKRVEDYTVEDVRAMDEISFGKLDVRKLHNREAMLAAFERKSKS